MSVRVDADSVLKYNTAVLRCRVPPGAAQYTEVVAWIRGNTHLFPSPRGGELREKKCSLALAQSNEGLIQSSPLFPLAISLGRWPAALARFT